MARQVFTTSVESADNLGLDPAIFTVTIGVHRLDGGLLSEEELAAARAALARVAKPKPAAAPAVPALSPAMAELRAIATGQPAQASAADEDAATLAGLAADIRAIATGAKPAAELPASRPKLTRPTVFHHREPLANRRSPGGPHVHR